jgi:predicted HicB family RNase H-like nuclease
VVASEAKTAILNIRIRPSVKATASARAAADRRSLAAYIELLIERDAENAPLLKKLKKT